jgi:hypothetical protein
MASSAIRKVMQRPRAHAAKMTVAMRLPTTIQVNLSAIHRFGLHGPLAAVLRR